MLFPILTIVCGLITAAPLIVARKPNAAQIFARIAPYQGFVGVGALALGILWLVRWLPNLTASFTSLSGAMVTGMIVLDIALGFVLGYGLLSGLLARNAAAKEKSEAVFAKLTRVQIPMGVGAAALGVSSFLL